MREQQSQKQEEAYVQNPHPGGDPCQRLAPRQYAHNRPWLRQQRDDGVLGHEETHPPRRPMAQKIQPMGLRAGKWGAITAPTVEKLTATTVFSSQ